MSEIIKTEAVVLKSIKYGETSKIVTFYTRELGKLTGIIKGARRPKNAAVPPLQPMSHVSLVVYWKQGRDVQTVSQCDLLSSFRHIPESLEKLAIGMSMIELVDRVEHGQEQNVRLFCALVDLLAVLNDATKNLENVLYKFEVYLADVLGFRCSFTNCVSCHRKVPDERDHKQTVDYHLEKGGPLCGTCAGLEGQKTKLSKQAFRILAHISSESDLDRLLNLAVGPKLHSQIEGFLWSYLKVHVPGIRPLRSREVFLKIRQAN